MWTPTALASEFRAYRHDVWRVVEAQHRISTNRLVSNLDDQARLEQLAEGAKPDVPKSARGKHYLIASPFRYGHSVASRFRRADERPGIFYASEHEATAIAETAYWRLRFFSRSPGFVPPSTTSEHLSFKVSVKAKRALDLTYPPFVAEAAKWVDPIDYGACQELAGAARMADAQLIRSISARDPEMRANVAIFDPAAIASGGPAYGQTWHFRFEQGRLSALAAFPGGGGNMSSMRGNSGSLCKSSNVAGSGWRGEGLFRAHTPVRSTPFGLALRLLIPSPIATAGGAGDRPPGRDRSSCPSTPSAASCAPRAD